MFGLEPGYQWESLFNIKCVRTVVTMKENVGIFLQYFRGAEIIWANDPQHQTGLANKQRIAFLPLLLMEDTGNPSRHSADLISNLRILVHTAFQEAKKELISMLSWNPIAVLGLDGLECCFSSLPSLLVEWLQFCGTHIKRRYPFKEYCVSDNKHQEQQ